MMQINNHKIDVIAKIASEIVKEQTVEELKDLTDHAGKMYDEGKLAAEIAVKLFLRVAGIELETRAISPVDDLVSLAETEYRANYAG